MMVGGHCQGVTSHGQRSWLGGVGGWWCSSLQKRANTYGAECMSSGRVDDELLAHLGARPHSSPTPGRRDPLGSLRAPMHAKLHAPRARGPMHAARHAAGMHMQTACG